MRKTMSLIDFGIENGFIEKGKDYIVVFPKRVINAEMLNAIFKEADDDYIIPERIMYSHPVMLKKKNSIDFTEVLVKLFGLTLRYGIDFKVNTFVHEMGGEITVAFKYRGKEVAKHFDVDMLCNMEKDYVLNWLEETLQKIDAEMQEKTNE